MNINKTSIQGLINFSDQIFNPFQKLADGFQSFNTQTHTYGNVFKIRTTVIRVTNSLSLHIIPLGSEFGPKRTNQQIYRIQLSIHQQISAGLFVHMVAYYP